MQCCSLADWESVNALDRFPHLTELRLQRVPLLASHSPSSARQVRARACAGW